MGHGMIMVSCPLFIEGERYEQGKNKSMSKITALYCRISLDDGGDNESMSISNQKIMLRDFAEKHGMFQYEYYVDDGYTGRNFNRPAFQRMIADIEAGKIGCVITKDLSRLGRNYIEAGSYIEIFFPKHNVRYIAITDGANHREYEDTAVGCAQGAAEHHGERTGQRGADDAAGQDAQRVSGSIRDRALGDKAEAHNVVHDAVAALVGAPLFGGKRS